MDALLEPAQVDLALLLDLEARWENLRGDQSASHGTMSGTDGGSIHRMRFQRLVPGASFGISNMIGSSTA